MIRIEEVEISGFKGAVLGMRLPLQSEGDSFECMAHGAYSGVEGDWSCPENCPINKKLEKTPYEGGQWLCGCAYEGMYILGEKDSVLAKRLAREGTSQGKFLRMIQVQALITAPVYWWREMDTYKVGTTANSSSIQHTGARRDFKVSDFSTDAGNAEINTTVEIMLDTSINIINHFRERYKETGDYSYFRAMRQFMPMSYNYTELWNANYQTLQTIYKQRKNHKLNEWQDFCAWVHTLPYSELITGEN